MSPKVPKIVLKPQLFLDVHVPLEASRKASSNRLTLSEETLEEYRKLYVFVGPCTL